MIVLTGAAGFIGSCMLKKLNDEKHQNIIIVDEFSRDDKNKNLAQKSFSQKIEGNLNYLDMRRKT